MRGFAAELSRKRLNQNGFAVKYSKTKGLRSFRLRCVVRQAAQGKRKRSERGGRNGNTTDPAGCGRGWRLKKFCSVFSADLIVAS
jgi:hypothetical protein